ncbi:MAG: eL32 family ribosomal protein [Nanoarchaeota archaeon]
MVDRKEVKARKPSFSRHEAGQKKRIGSSWRRPKGRQNKLRLGVKGYKAPVSKGYRMPRSLRNKDTVSGLEQCHITSMADVETVDPKTMGAIVSRAIGMRKKIEIIKKLQEKKVKILNIADVESYMKSFEEERSAAKQKKQARESKKKKAEEKTAKEEEKKKAEEKKKSEDKKSEESKSDQQKEQKEKEKILHHKQ